MVDIKLAFVIILTKKRAKGSQSVFCNKNYNGKNIE